MTSELYSTVVRLIKGSENGDSSPNSETTYKFISQTQRIQSLWVGSLRPCLSKAFFEY